MKNYHSRLQDTSDGYLKMTIVVYGIQYIKFLPNDTFVNKKKRKMKHHIII